MMVRKKAKNNEFFLQNESKEESERKMTSKHFR